MMKDIPSSITEQELYHYRYKTLSRYQPICNYFLRFELLYQFSALKKEKNMFKKVVIPAEAGIQISLS